MRRNMSLSNSQKAYRITVRAFALDPHLRLYQKRAALFNEQNYFVLLALLFGLTNVVSVYIFYLI